VSGNQAEYLKEGDEMRNVMFALAVLGMTMTTASAQQSPASPYFASGSNSPNGGYSSHDSGGCGSVCQAKCQGAWRALGFRSVNACVARWGKLNAEGTAATCEAAIKANGMRPIRGC